MNEIAKRRIDIEKKLKLYTDKLKSLEEECVHSNVTKTHCANTGNYDPSNDSYWTVFVCPDCGKIWQEEGSK